MKQRVRTLTIASFILLMAAGAKAQLIITTIAGQYSTYGYSGDFGPATDATLFGPSDLAFDGKSNLYFTDYVNQVVREIDTFGIITTIAGNGYGAGTVAGGGYSGDGGPATDAALNGPFALSVDPSGNIYFADGFNHVVRKISASGTISTFAGQHLLAGYLGDGGAATNAELNNPVGIAIDKAGNVYIADDHNNVIRKVNTSGVISTVAGNTITGYTGDGGPATAAELNLPVGIAFDTAGNLFIADSRNNVIRKVDTAGIISTYAGAAPVAGYTGDGGLATIATLDTPIRVNFDDSNNLYISDYYNNVIRKVDAVTGIITTIAGDGFGAGSGGTVGGYDGDDSAATNAELTLPCGIAFDRYHNTYIADRGNNLIRRIGPAPAIDHTGITSLAGIQNKLLVYPNPTPGGAFSIDLVSDNTEQAQMTVTNILGETVKRVNTITNKPLNLYLDEPAGIYFISATTPHGKWDTKLTVAK